MKEYDCALAPVEVERLCLSFKGDGIDACVVSFGLYYGFASLNLLAEL